MVVRLRRLEVMVEVGAVCWNSRMVGVRVVR